MSKSLLVTILFCVCAASAQDRAGGDLDKGVPSVDASPEALDKYLRGDGDSRTLTGMVEHLYRRIKGDSGVTGLDKALGQADARFVAVGGADAVQKALLFHGSEARETLRETYATLDDFTQKLGKARDLEKEADGRLKAVNAQQAVAAKRISTAAGEVRRFGAGMGQAPPRSEGGDERAGDLASIEPQEQELAEIKDRLDLATEALSQLEGSLKGIDALKAKVKTHAERAGMFDQGAGSALSMSVTGKGSAVGAGTSREIIADALATLEKASQRGEKSRVILAAIAGRTAVGAEKTLEAEQALMAAKEKTARALETAGRGHQEILSLAQGYAEADDKPARDDGAAKIKGETLAAAAGSAAGAQAAGAKAAAAQAPAASCCGAKAKSETAIGDPEAIGALKKLGPLSLKTEVKDGSARTGPPAERRVDVGRMQGILRNASFDGGRKGTR